MLTDYFSDKYKLNRAQPYVISSMSRTQAKDGFLKTPKTTFTFSSAGHIDNKYYGTFDLLFFKVIICVEDFIQEVLTISTY